MNKELKVRISEIRGLLKKNKMIEAYDKMVSLNEINEGIDDYTRYFAYASDLGIQSDNDYIVVEGVFDYMVATVHDFEDTLEEIEGVF